MTFVKLSELEVSDGKTVRTIALYRGDLTQIPKEHAVDLLVLSAFRDDYVPTPTSLIGALDRAGLSVAELAADKEHDLRSSCAIWLSRPIAPALGHLNIGRIACFESGFKGPTTAIVGDLFRGLFPFVNGDRDIVVAMPLLAAGDQRHPPEVMFDAIIHAASHWMARGLGISELKIVVRDPQVAEALASRLRRATAPATVQARTTVAEVDVFLSFSSVDADAAGAVKDALQKRDDIASVFDYRFAIDKGASWQDKIDEAITSCRSIVAIISPTYIASPECKEELSLARLRHKREGGAVLFPIYWRKWEGDLALWLQLINAVDCREADLARLAESIPSLAFRAPH